MSISSFSATRVPSSRLSTCAGSYEGDIESLAFTDSEREHCSVYSSCYESLPSPAFQIISTGRSSTATLAEESSSLFESESETETETSSSDTSTVIYTDSDFCRVQRTAGDGLVESAQVTQSDERYKWQTGGVSDTRINTARATALFLCNAKPITSEASNVSFGVNEDDFSQELYQSNLSQQERRHKDFLTRFKVMEFENGSQTAGKSFHKNQKEVSAHESNVLPSSQLVDDNCFNDVGLANKLNSPETTIQESELAEQQITEKQRSLRRSFSSVLKEARRSVREARGSLSAQQIKSRGKQATNKLVNKHSSERRPRLKVQADSNKEGNFEKPIKWVVSRRHVNRRSIKLIKQRKKQDAIEFEKRQVEMLITEMKVLDLHKQAANVQNALAFKNEKEKEYENELEAKRQDINRKKYIEACRQKEEIKRKRLEETRRKEAERKEKEDLERKKRIEEARIRSEKNRMLWESYNTVLLANSVSRSFTFSYFPKLRLQPLERPQTEPPKKTHSEKHVDNCHR